MGDRDIRAEPRGPDSHRRLRPFMNMVRCPLGVRYAIRSGHAKQLKQSRSRMVLEQFGVANVAAQGVNRLMTAHIHHFEDGHTCAGGRRRGNQRRRE